MKRSKHRFGTLFLLTAATALVVSCASGPEKKKDDWPSATREDFGRPPTDPCDGKDGKPVECTSNDACCKGYVCTLDPERSRVVHYCIQG